MLQYVRQLFHEDKYTLLKLCLVECNWRLVLVRVVLEAIQDNRIQDEFSNLQSNLRKWVGLY